MSFINYPYRPRNHSDGTNDFIRNGIIIGTALLSNNNYSDLSFLHYNNLAPAVVFGGLNAIVHESCMAFGRLYFLPGDNMSLSKSASWKGFTLGLMMSAAVLSVNYNRIGRCAAPLLNASSNLTTKVIPGEQTAIKEASDHVRRLWNKYIP